MRKRQAIENPEALRREIIRGGTGAKCKMVGAVVYRPIDALKLDPRNPRAHSEFQIRGLRRSIEAFGFIVPVLIDGNCKVLAGHCRILAARQLGLSELPTIKVGHLSEAQARAFIIADNRLTEIAAWDEQLLGQQLQELSLMDLGFSLEVTGFEMGEIDLRIEGLASAAAPLSDPADDVPAASGPAVSRAGDLWLLDDHRVLCGSALEAASYTRLLGSHKAAMVITDPPFNLPIGGHVSGFGAVRHREFAMGAGEMSAAEFTTFLTTACTLLASCTASSAIFYCFMDWRHVVEVYEAGRAAGLSLLNICVWAKATAGMGSLYRSQYELVFVFRNGGGRHRNNIQLGRFGRNRSNLWNYPGALGLRTSEEGNLGALHPTAKPVALVADAIMDVSARGAIVLDAFLGSGTAIIAAERTGRRCYGLEIDPLYADTIVRRWQEFTRGRAVRAGDGRSFGEIEEEVKRSDGH